MLKIGLLGCGGIAQFAHLPALRRTNKVRLTAICDASSDLLQSVGQEAGVLNLYTDYAQFLAKADIDAVIIAVPDDFHVSLSAQALKAGKHVLVEKPMGNSVEECRELIDLVEQTGLVLQVGSMKRHDPGIAYAHQFIQERLGRILSVSGIYCDTLFRPQLQKSLLPPLRTSKQSIKPVTDPKTDVERYSLRTHGIHLLDTIRYLAGNVDGLYTRHAEQSGQHTWHGLLDFSSGAIGHFELTVKVNADWSEEYIIQGEGGRVIVRPTLWFYHRPSFVEAFDTKNKQTYKPLITESNLFTQQLESFASSVLSGESANPDVYEGLASVALLDAVGISSVNNKYVNVEKTMRAS